MPILVDTSVVVRAHTPTDPAYAICLQYLDIKVVQQMDLVCFTQTIVEYWAVATRPSAVNGLGMAPDRARLAIDRILSFLPCLEEPPGLMRQWLNLVTQFKVSGKPTHDARLVALMDLHGIADILTQNGGDFRRYGHIRAIQPVLPTP